MARWILAVRRRRSMRNAVLASTLCAFVWPLYVVQAQDIEPRAYSNAPVGVNFLNAGYAYARGGMAFDSSLSLTNPKLKASSLVLAYARELDLWG